MIETLHGMGQAAQAIEAGTAFAFVDGLAEAFGAQEVLLLQVDTNSGWDYGWVDVHRVVKENLFGQPDFHDVTRFAAFDQT